MMIYAHAQWFYHARLDPFIYSCSKAVSFLGDDVAESINDIRYFTFFKQFN